MSCLFNSLASLIQQDPAQLRADICAFLESNPAMMDDIKADTIVHWENGQSMQDYVRGMRQSHTWGGAIEVKAFTQMTGLGVVVVDLRSGKYIEFVPPSTPTTRPPHVHRRLYVTYTGSHYEPFKVE